MEEIEEKSGEEILSTGDLSMADTLETIGDENDEELDGALAFLGTTTGYALLWDLLPPLFYPTPTAAIRSCDWVGDTVSTVRSAHNGNRDTLALGVWCEVTCEVPTPHSGYTLLHTDAKCVKPNLPPSQLRDCSLAHLAINCSLFPLTGIPSLHSTHHKFSDIANFPCSDNNKRKRVGDDVRPDVEKEDERASKRQNTLPDTGAAEVAPLGPLLPPIPLPDPIPIAPLPAAPKLWRIKFVSSLDPAEIKLCLHILLKGKKIPGYSQGKLETLKLRDPVNNVIVWELEWNKLNTTLARAVLMDTDLASPLNNNKGIFVMNHIPRDIVGEGILDDDLALASEEKYRRYPLLMTGPTTPDGVANIVRWLAGAKEDKARYRAHPRAQVVGTVSGNAQMLWALVEAYHPDTYAWLARSTGPDFEKLPPEGPPSNFYAVPWCKAPFLVYLKESQFAHIKRQTAEDWVTSTATVLKAPNPVGVAALTSPQTGTALGGLALVFDNKVNALPWYPLRKKEPGSGQVEEALKRSNMTAEVLLKWGGPPKQDSGMVITSTYPHVRGARIARPQPSDYYAKPNGAGKQKKGPAGNKKKAAAVKAIPKSQRKHHAHKRIVEKAEKKQEVDKSPATAKKSGSRGGKFAQRNSRERG
jgi:hypothetical protein